MSISWEQRTALYEAFAARAAALEPAAWDRIAARCTDLEGQEFSALIRRARVAKQPFAASLQQASPSWLRSAVASAGGAVLTTLGVVGEIASEFERPDPGLPRRLESAAATATDPRARRHLLAAARLERALLPQEERRPGMTTAVRAAAHAVFMWDTVDRAGFDAIYAPVEPEIPIDDLVNHTAS